MNRRRMTLKQLALMLCMALTAAHAAPGRIRGELTFSFYGVAQVRECGTQRPIEFGVMESKPYFSFLKRHDEIAGPEKRPILVEAEGEVNRSSEGRWILHQPRIVSMQQGKCEAPR
jgi:hypothetical protein